MRGKEDYTRLMLVVVGLALVILVLFQITILGEPARISGVEAHDKEVAIKAGHKLYADNCTLCHGDNGEGTEGRPALNDKALLDATDDSTLFSLISSGVPNTEMPAWNQANGGPLTNEDVRNLTAYVRSWQATAPDRRTIAPPGDLSKGRALYGNLCVACHGKNGEGNGQIAALNDPAKLSQFDDAWYRDAIAKGRPAKGMPTWGTVLSPHQISDLVAVIDLWRQNAPAPAAATAVTATGAVTTTPAAAATGPVAATPAITPTAETAGTPEIARPSNPGGPGPAVALTGSAQAGAQVYTANCQKCHGDNGTGGVANPGSDDGTIPALNPIDETLVDKDLKVYAANLDLFLEHGSNPAGPSPKEMMPAWGDEKKLTPQQIADVIAYIVNLNPPK